MTFIPSSNQSTNTVNFYRLAAFVCDDWSQFCAHRVWPLHHTTQSTCKLNLSGGQEKVVAGRCDEGGCGLRSEWFIFASRSQTIQCTGGDFKDAIQWDGDSRLQTWTIYCPHHGRGAMSCWVCHRNGGFGLVSEDLMRTAFTIVERSGRPHPFGNGRDGLKLSDGATQKSLSVLLKPCPILEQVRW